MTPALRLLLPIVLIGLAAGGPVSAAPDNGTQAAVFKPDPSVTCDRSSQVCHDDKGPAFGWTKVTFGLDAALKLARQQQLIVNPDGSVYRLSEHERCDLTVRVCYRGTEPDATLTGAQFGRAAVDRLHRFQQQVAQAKGQVIKIAPGLECSRKVHICYDRHGPNVALTRLAFGNKDALQLLDVVLHRQAKAAKKG